MKLKPIVYCLGLLSSSIWADSVLNSYRQGDFKTAAEMFAKQAPQDVWGQYYLGEMSLYGYGVLRNNQQAVASYEASAQKGFLPAILLMGKYELLIQKNPEAAFSWFKKAADMEDESALMFVAAAYKFGIGVSKNEDLSRKYYITAAKLGNPLAQESLAEHFLENKHAKNNMLGWLWLNKAIAQNYIPALVLKARILYQEGQTQEAMDLIKQATIKKYWPAFYQKGLWALEQKNWKVAHQYLLFAAKKGYQPAQIALSELYQIEGTPYYHKNYAYLWMLYAAQHQNIQAQKKLAQMYREGIIVESNEDLAKAWMELSYQTQKNSPESFTQAARWLSAERATQFAQTDYRLKGIWTDWHNPQTLKINRLNAYPKFIDLSVKQLFKPQFEQVHSVDVPLSAYWDAILKVKGPLSPVAGDYPHYMDLLKQPLNAQAMEKLKLQANLGVIQAQFLLAQCYLKGVGVTQNLEEARSWLVKASNQDNLGAQYELAMLDIQSKDQDLQLRGLERLRDAAFKGNTYAEYVYGLMSEQGLKTESGKTLLASDMKEAKNMWMLAAVNGDGQAKYRLAEVISREPQDTLTLTARLERDKMLRDLYHGAVEAGIKEAELPLAFYDANSPNSKLKNWAYQTAQVYADKGNLEASLLLALMMEKNPDTKKYAKKWFEAAKEHPIGGFAWASFLENPQDQKLYLEKAAAADFSYASLNLAILKHQMGQSPNEDLNKAVNLHNHQASFLLANLLMLEDDPKSISHSRQIFEDLARLGDPEGQWKLGYLQVLGLGGPKDINAGNDNLNQAAKTQSMAQYVLGYVNHMGYLQEKPDEELAKKWFKLAASNIPDAWIGLGYIYETFDKDYGAAKAAYEESLKNHNVLGNYNIGLIYEYGKGQPMNFAKAQQYFLAASEEGSSQSMLRLASVYLYGKESNKYAKEAFKWYQKAAEKGEADAYYHLGLMYEGGVAIRLNQEEALKNYQKAAELGDARAVLAVKRLTGDTAISKPLQAEVKTQQVRPFAKLSMDLQYIYVLDRLNHGYPMQAEQSLLKILQAHPEYAPAKYMWQNMHG